MKNFFNKIDLFGKPVSIKFLGKETSKSAVGGLFSLLFFGFVLWAVYQVGQDIIYKQSPKITVSETFSGDPEPMILSPDTFNFAFGLVDPVNLTHYINESIYKGEVILQIRERVIDQDGKINFIFKTIQLELERCTKDHFGSNGPKFETMELDQLYCIKKQQTEIDKIRIQGVFESALFEYIRIFIKPCNPKTSNVTCAPQETLEKMLKCNFGLYYPNIGIDTRSFSQPNITFRDSYYTSISTSFTKNIPFYLNHVKVNSDFGWLMPDKEIKGYIKVGSIRENIKIFDGIPLSIDIRVDKITTTYERSYIKVQDIFAAANGLATAGLLFIFFILSPYCKMKFYEGLINELFDVKVPQENENNTKSEKDANFYDNRFGSIVLKDDSIETPSKLKKPKVTKNQKLGRTRLQTLDPKFQRINIGGDILNYKTGSEGYLEKLGPNSEQPSPKLEPRLFSYLQSPVDTSNIRSPEISRTVENSSQQSPLKMDKSKNFQLVPKKSLLDSSIISFVSSHRSQPGTPKRANILDQYENADPAKSLAVLENLIFDKYQQDNDSKYNNLNEKVKAEKEKVKTFSPKANQTRQKISQFGRTEDDLLEDHEEQMINEKAKSLPSFLFKESDKIQISFSEYVCSFLWKSKSLKDKLHLLNEGARRIEERLDIFNMLKKFREVDKLKLLLLDNEQLVLFDALPKPELSLNRYQSTSYRQPSSKFKEIKFISEKRQKDLIVVSYKCLKKNKEKTLVDMKLLDIYDDILRLPKNF